MRQTPPPQGSRLPWYQSTVLVGEDLGDFYLKSQVLRRESQERLLPLLA